MTVAISSGTTLRASPYKGLTPYTEEDAAFFFGRETERQMIAANLLASRLTLLYGPSGVGKSSVLLAGVLTDLHEHARRNAEDGESPGWAVAVVREWRDDPVENVANAVRLAVGPDVAEPPSGLPLDELFAHWTRVVQGKLLIIFDQFEEYFLYHEGARGPDTFDGQFPHCVNRADLRVNFLLSLRHDALARLDRFKGRIPNLFDNRLQIDHLSVGAARDAVLLPLEEYNRRASPDDRVVIEGELVDDVLRQVGVGRLSLAGDGATPPSEAGAQTRIDTAFLQVVLTALWNVEARAESHTLRAATLRELGGADAIARDSFQARIQTLTEPEQDVAAHLFQFLVTRSGTKIAHTASDLAEFAGLEEEVVEPVLARLAAGDARILRSVPPPEGTSASRYEIFHDVLATPVLEWRAEHRRKRQEAERRRLQRRRLLRIVGGTLLAALVVFTALGAYAIKQARDVGRQRADNSRALVQTAQLQLGIDPAPALALAARALQLSATPEAEDTLRAALAQSRLRRVLIGGAAAVTSASYSADGRRILTSSPNGTARLWDATSGRELRRFHVEKVAFRGAMLDPTGRFVAAISSPPRLWDARTGRPIRLEGANGLGEPGVTFSPDGRLLAATDEQFLRPRVLTTVVRVWRTTGGPPLVTLRRAGGDRLEFSPDGRRILSADSFGYSARILGFPSGQTIAELRDSARVTAVAYSPDGRVIATGNADGGVRLWDGNGRRLGSLRGHTAQVNSVAFNAEGTRLVTASADKTVRIWSVGTRRPAALLIGHGKAVESASFGRGDAVVSASSDGTARVWDRRGTARFVLRGHVGTVYDAQFSPDGRHVVTAGADRVARIWDIAGPRQLAAFHLQPGRAEHASGFGVQFSRDGRYVVVRAGFADPVVYDSSGRLVARLRGTLGTVTSAAISPDDKLVVTATSVQPPRVWELPSGRPLRWLRGHTPTNLAGAPAYVRRVAFSDDGRRLLTGGYDGTVRVWDVGTWRTLDVLRASGGGYGYVDAATFNPNGELIATAGYGASPKIWDAATGRLIRALPDRRDSSCASFSPDSRLLVTCGSNGTAAIWDVETGVRRFALHGHKHDVWSGVFNRDGTLVVTTGGDRTARVWSTSTGRQLFAVHGVGGYPATFNADGTLLAAAGSIVEARTGRQVATVGVNDPPFVSAVGPGGVVAAISIAGSGGIYRCEPCQSLRALFATAVGRVHNTLTAAERRRFDTG